MRFTVYLYHIWYYFPLYVVSTVIWQSRKFLCEGLVCTVTLQRATPCLDFRVIWLLIVSY